jgi:hypothetical protein
MRALVACLAVVAAIALPGVIVAATSSPGQLGSSYSSSQLQVLPAETVPSGLPSTALMTASLSVEAALDEQGKDVRFVGDGPSQVELQGTSGGSCPVRVIFRDESAGLSAYANSCGTGEFVHDNVKIVYSPPSIGPTVRRAVANLR